MLAVVLALGSSIALGSTDFLGGLKSRQLGVLTVLVCSQLISVFLIALAVVVTGEGISPGPEFALFVLGSGVAQLVGVFAFWNGLRLGAMGVVAPVTAAGGAAIPIVVGLVGGDDPSALQLTGIAVAVAGVVLASYQPTQLDGDGSRLASGVGWALLAGVGFGTFYVLIAGASEHGSALSATISTRVFTAGVLLVPAVVLRSRISAARSDIPTLAAIGALEVTGILLFAAAADRGLLSIVGAVGNLYPLTTVGLAHRVLGERLRPIQGLGSLAAIVGIAMIGAGAAT